MDWAWLRTFVASDIATADVASCAVYRPGGRGHSADRCLRPRCKGRCGNAYRRVDTVHGRRRGLEWLPRRRRRPREL